MKIFSMGRLALLAFACFVVGSTSAMADPVNIRMGWSTMPGHLIPVLFSKPEILKHYGVSYTVEPIRFRGSSPQISALAAGQIDTAAFGALTLDLGVNNARLDLRVIADIIQDGVDGYHSETFMVRKDSGINSVADMKGKRIGSNAIGSASDTAMRAMLQKNDMVDKRDFTVVETAFPNIPAMIDEKKLDMGTVLQPMSGQLLKSGNFKTLYTSADAIGPSQLVFMVAQADFLAKNHDAVMDFMEDYVRAVRWFTAPANKQEAVKIIADFMQQKPDTLDYIFTKEDYYRDPYMVPNIDTIQTGIDIALKLELAKQDLKVAPDYADLSFVNEAKRRIEADAK